MGVPSNGNVVVSTSNSNTGLGLGLLINPAYFGPAILTEETDLTTMVYQVEGTRRNLPQIQFEKMTPLGKRVFITYREGLDPPSAAEQTITPTYPRVYPPGAIFLTGFPASSNIDLIWTRPQAAVNTFISFYSLYRSVDNGAFSLIDTTNNALSYIDTAVSNTHNYAYYVTATANNNLSTNSNTVDIQGNYILLFTSNGVYTPLPGVIAAKITVLGAGAGGAAGDYNNDGIGGGPTAFGGMGGGGGAFAQATFNISSLGVSTNVVIGMGGLGGTSNSSNATFANQLGRIGANGSASIFGNLITCQGGFAWPNTVHAPPIANANVIGGLSVTMESGGLGGNIAQASSMTALRPGGSTANAGPGGSGGSGALQASGGTFQVYEPGPAQPGSNSATSGIAAGSVGAYSNTTGNNFAPPVGAASPGIGIVGGGSGAGGGFAGANTGTNISTFASPGGDGAGYAAGGGGGGGLCQVVNANPIPIFKNGAGGNGAPGVVQVISLFW